MTESTQSQSSWSEEFSVEAERLGETLKELVRQANVRRVIIRKQNDEVLLDLPLPAGLLFGGLFALYLPVIAIITAVAGAAARLKVQVIRRVDQATG